MNISFQLYVAFVALARNSLWRLSNRRSDCARFANRISANDFTTTEGPLLRGTFEASLRSSSRWPRTADGMPGTRSADVDDIVPALPSVLTLPWAVIAVREPPCRLRLAPVRGGVGLPTRAGTARFLVQLAQQHPLLLVPHAARLLKSLQVTLA